MAKKTTLPEIFEDILALGDLPLMMAVFEDRDVNARGGYAKQPALSFNTCPDELTRWLVAQGADLAAENTYGETPLHARAGSYEGNIAILLELGAPVNHSEGGRGTPLHAAAARYNVDAVTLLLAYGAHANALNREGQTPLVHALQRCNNIDIERMVPLAEVLLAAMGAPAKPAEDLLGGLFGGGKAPSAVTPEMQDHVARIGKTFEFARSRFNPEYVDATSNALDRLYQIFDVPPVPRRILHDGVSSIVARAKTAAKRHDELWALLVPASGPAATVQGEVIRLSGRISTELDFNGGGNWDADYRAMADAFLKHVGSGTALPEVQLAEARELVAARKRKDGDTVRLCELALDWVALNPTPVALGPVGYKR